MEEVVLSLLLGTVKGGVPDNSKDPLKPLSLVYQEEEGIEGYPGNTTQGQDFQRPGRCWGSGF